MTDKISYKDNIMYVDGKEIITSRIKEPENCNWKELDIDLVMDCTGKFTDKEKAEAHIKAGAKKVLLSAPAKGDLKTIVYNVNHNILDGSETVVSAASCTTNCLAPLAKVINDEFGIVKGLMTTVHAYTNDQNIHDNSHKKGIKARRGRAAAANIVPASTGAAKTVGVVMPELKGRLDGIALRVPTLTGSVVDLTVELKRNVTVEEGDLDKPKMVFFFDEAHLLFEDAPKQLLDKIELVVRLIRSKGVGVYFVTQNPADVPNDILGQLGNRIQHALRAYTPAERKKVVTAAETFRENPEFDTVEAITQLGTGEALISCLDEKGIPSVVERAFILPPQSQFGTIDDMLRNQIIVTTPAYKKYYKAIDRESAYEMLTERAERKREEDLLELQRLEEEKRLKMEAKEEEKRLKEEEKRLKAEERERERQRKELEKTMKKSTNRLTSVERVTNSAMSAIGREVGRSLIRGILGTLKK
jgi:aspartate-semialdehyde dehydrogenase